MSYRRKDVAIPADYCNLVQLMVEENLLIEVGLVHFMVSVSGAAITCHAKPRDILSALDELADFVREIASTESE